MQAYSKTVLTPLVDRFAYIDSYTLAILKAFGLISDELQ